MSTTVMITGAVGFIGSGLTQYWCREHPTTRALIVSPVT